MARFRKEKLPISMKGQWEKRSDFLLMNISNKMIWFVRLFSPIAWIGAFFQNEINGKYYTNPIVSEIYLIIATIIPFGSMFLPIECLQKFQIIGVLCMLFGIESIQYQFRSIILRPFFQENYKPYSFERILVITLIQYFQIIFVFSIIYRSWFSADFNIDALGRITALEFSIITITTVGFGSIYPKPGTLVSLIAALEGVIGIIYIGVMMAMSVSRISEVKDVGSKK